MKGLRERKLCVNGRNNRILVKEEDQNESFAKKVTKMVSNLLGKVAYTT